MDTFGGLIMAAGNTIFANVKDQRALENLKGTAEEREAAARSQQKKQVENTDESIKAQTATLQLQRDAQKELQNMIHAGSAATSYLMLKLAEATKTQAGRLPNADGTQGMIPGLGQYAEEKYKANKQMRSQGVGGLPDETEAERKSAQIAATGEQLKPTETQIYEKAVREMAEFVPALAEATKKASADAEKLVGNTAGDVTRELINQLREGLRNLAPLPAVRPDATPQAQPRSFANPDDLSQTKVSTSTTPPIQKTPALPQRRQSPIQKTPALPQRRQSPIDTNLEELKAANNPAYPSVASMKYKQSVNPDLSQQVEFTKEDASRAMAKNSALPEKTTNEDIIASNAILERKMDELIDISRGSRSYLEKISNQAYA